MGLRVAALASSVRPAAHCIHGTYLQMQASGSVLITVQQGDDDASVAYSSGCTDSTCEWARPQTSRVRLRGGCSEVVVRFVDGGAAFTWLRVSGRATSEECRGSPQYPACNTVGRRLLTAAADDELAWAVMRADAGDAIEFSEEWAGAARAVLDDSEGGRREGRRDDREGEEGEGGGRRGRGGSAGPRRVSGYDMEREAAGAGAGEDDAEADVRDTEENDRADLDADIDAACSVFNVRFSCPLCERCWQTR